METLQLEQTKIGFNIVSGRLQISQDLVCSLQKSDSNEVFGRATLVSVSFARGINWEELPNISSLVVSQQILHKSAVKSPNIKS